MRPGRDRNSLLITHSVLGPTRAAGNITALLKITPQTTRFGARKQVAGTRARWLLRCKLGQQFAHENNQSDAPANLDLADRPSPAPSLWPSLPCLATRATLQQPLPSMKAANSESESAKSCAAGVLVLG